MLKLTIITPYFTPDTVDITSCLNDNRGVQVSAIVPYTGWIGTSYAHGFGYSYLPR